MTDAIHIFDSGAPPGLPVGAHYFGIGQGGALLSEMPATGEHGPGYMVPSVDPADTAARFYGVIKEVPSGLTLTADEYGRVVGQGASDGRYIVPFDLYRQHQLLGAAAFSFEFGAVGPVLTLVPSDLTQANGITSVAATITPAGGNVLTLVVANLTQHNTISSVAATVSLPPETPPDYIGPSSSVDFDGGTNGVDF